jgi:hypothetical protein
LLQQTLVLKSDDNILLLKNWIQKLKQTQLVLFLLDMQLGIALIGFVLIFGSSFLITKYYHLTLKPRFVGAIFTGVGLTYFIENVEALI